MLESETKEISDYLETDVRGLSYEQVFLLLVRRMRIIERFLP